MGGFQPARAGWPHPVDPAQGFRHFPRPLHGNGQPVRSRQAEPEQNARIAQAQALQAHAEGVPARLERQHYRAGVRISIPRHQQLRARFAIHPQAAQRIRDYLELAKHGDDIEGPLFRPVRDNRKGLEARRYLHPDVIDRTLRKYARHIGLARGYSAHSMRATFITTALDNGASLEEVQSAAGHADPSTTKLYDRRGYNPEKSASFFANY